MVKSMTAGNPLKLIIGFAIPIMLGNLIQQLYNFADSVMVGKLLGNEALGAVGSTGSIVFLILGFINGISEGSCILVARYFGAKDYDTMKKCVCNIFYVLSITVICVSVLSFTLSRDILEFMKSPDDIIDLADGYIEIIYLGMFATMMYNLAAGLLRALGDSRSPLYFLIISAVLNVALNYVLIAIIPLGVRGAALATVASQLFAAVCCIIFIRKKCDLLRVGREHMRPDGRLIRQVCSMGLPMGLQYSITAIGAVVLQSSINSLGSVAVTGYAAADKILTPCWQMLNCAGVALANYCSQNLGAGNLARIKKGVRDAGGLILVVGACVGTVLFFFGEYAAVIFLDEINDEVMGYISTYFAVLSPSFVCLAAIGVFRNTVQGLGFSAPAMISGGLELVGRCTLAIVFVPVFGYTAACVASPVAWIMADILLIGLYFYAIRSLSKKHPDWCGKAV